MKKTILFLLAIAAIVAACEPTETTAFQIKATDMISISPAQNVYLAQKVKATNEHLSALEIVKQTTIICTPEFERSFIKEQRDTTSIPPKLLMWATDVITLDGKLVERDWQTSGWIDASDVVFIRVTDNVRDTIAYIPNQVLRSAETAIRAAYEEKDIEECYRIFNEAYTFTPITGSEWRALKANGQN